MSPPRNPRLTFLLALAGSWLLALVFRLYDLQIRDHDRYRVQAERQQQRVVGLDEPRGTIYDARGRELAVSVEVTSVAADPSLVEDPEATAGALAGALGLDAAKLRRDLESPSEFVWIRRKLDPPAARRVETLDLPGVIFLRESKRYFPMRRLAAPVLGYVGTDNVGLAGLEYLYDRVIASKRGRRTVVRDARAGTVVHPNLERYEATPGRDVRLTLDAAIQHLVERELEAAVKQHRARRGMVVVLEPRSGAVLAMASYPAFDPNRFAAAPRENWRNRTIEDAFEPGSTFKMITAAAALEAGAVDPLQTIDCEMGGTVVDGVRIADHKPFGLLTAREIIAKSSNVGAIKLGRAAGPRRLYRTIRAFGVGRPTGVDLPSESAGILRPLEQWSKRQPAYVSFGQSVSLTALQLANAFAVVANGGRLMTPYVVDAIGRGEERRPAAERGAGVPVISRASVIQVRSMLESVVLEGTAKRAAIPGYSVAGKTGTAQKAIPGRGYAARKYVASFVGFAPVRRPALVCAVILDEPWPRYHGGDVAAPVFQRIASQALIYLGVPPERDRLPERPAPPAGLAELETPAPERGIVPPGTVPDLAGLSAREAVTRSAAAGLRLVLNDHGAVARQMPAPGTPLEASGGLVEVWLEDT